MKAFLLLLAVIVLSGCSSPTSTDQLNPPEIWGDLESGPYVVGFKTHFLFDKTKPPVPYVNWQDDIFPTNETIGRQMQLNLWYPAAKVSGKRVSFGDYVDLISQQTDFSILDTGKVSFANDQFILKTNLLGGNGEFTLEKLEKLRALPTYAYDEAIPAEGQFPLILFPNGSSPASQSLMCEFLASYGFVVAGFAPKGQFGSLNEASTKGIEMAVSDIEFAVQQLSNIPSVDINNLALIGNAINSSHITAYQTRNPKVKCLVSLEGGLLSAFEQRLLDKTVFYEPGAVNVPILAIYAPHPSIYPSYISHLKYSDRYFFHFPQMSEFHFLNYGLLEQFVPDIIGKPKGNVQEGYESGAEIILNFMQTFLLNSQDKRDFYVQYEDSYPEGVDTLFQFNSVPQPPDILSVKNSYRKLGFSYIDSIYNAHKPVDTQPFSLSFYTDIKDWLAWKKDEEYVNRKKLYALAYDSYPNSVEVNFYLGYFALMTKDTDLTKKHYAIAQQLIDRGTDPELTMGRKQQIERYMEEDLKTLE